MIFAAVNDDGRSTTNTLPLVRVGYDNMIRKFDDLIQRLVWAFPAFTHKNTIDLMLLNKFVEVICFIVDASWIYVHNSWKV